VDYVGTKKVSPQERWAEVGETRIGGKSYCGWSRLKTPSRSKDEEMGRDLKPLGGGDNICEGSKLLIRIQQVGNLKWGKKQERLGLSNGRENKKTNGKSGPTDRIRSIETIAIQSRRKGKSPIARNTRSPRRAASRLGIRIRRNRKGGNLKTPKSKSSEGKTKRGYSRRRQIRQIGSSTSSLDCAEDVWTRREAESERDAKSNGIWGIGLEKRKQVGRKMRGRSSSRREENGVVYGSISKQAAGSTKTCERKILEGKIMKA